jgi:hypothetical protein
LIGNLLVVITSVLSSGVIAAIISFSFSEAKERWLLRRTKIEEIYLNATEWLKSASVYFLPAVGVCKGQLTYNQMLDQQLKGQEKASDFGLKHLRMKKNIYMYEPSLIPTYEQMERERNKTVRLIFAIRDCWEKTGQASECLGPFNKQIDAFERASDALQKAIIERGVAIGAEKGQAAQAYDLTRSRLSKGAAWLSITAKRAWSRLPYRGDPPHG